MNRSRINAGIITLLLVTLMVGGFFMMRKQSQLTTENTTLSTELDSLESVKFDLLEQIENMQFAYGIMVASNDSLTTSLNEALTTIDQQKNQLKTLKRQSAGSIDGLQKEIRQLTDIKEDLQGTIARLQEENAALLAQNTSLSEELQRTVLVKNALSDRNGELEQANGALLSEREQLRAASVKASGFQVDVEKKSDKLTSKGNRARKINLSFDIVNVPEEHQGAQTLYLVITDEKGMPVQTVTPVRTRITVNGQTAEIEAQQAKEVTLGENQRFVFNQMLEDKMKAGNYRAAIYSKMGMLGAVNFRMS